MYFQSLIEDSRSFSYDNNLWDKLGLIRLIVGRQVQKEIIYKLVRQRIFQAHFQHH